MTAPWTYLMRGDCLERMREVPDGYVDLVLCDLPYGTTTCAWDVVIPLDSLWKEYWRLCKHNVVLFGAQPFTTTLISSQLKHFKYCWVWRKNAPTGFGLAKYQPMRVTEDIAVFFKSPGKYNKQETRTIIKDRKVVEGRKNGTGSSASHHVKGLSKIDNVQREIVNPRNLLEFDVVPNAGGGKVHPTQKPVPLLEYLIRTYTDEGAVVLDNTMGSGSTGVACMNTGRSFIGIERDEGYFATAQRRVREAEEARDAARAAAPPPAEQPAEEEPVG